ncbi:MAG: TatD family hydrolase [Frankiaceae bacterium]|nr:TatD family hydrolase [Arenimonas sp.]
MPASLFDSHCHLDAAEFDSDRAGVIDRALQAGVTQQLVPAVAYASWPKLQQVCATQPGLYPAYGLHPMHLAQHQPGHLTQLREWIEKEKPRAIGECGLDFFVEGLDAVQQRFYLNGQLELAREFDLPVVLHARRAVEEVTATLRRFAGLRGVVHSYSGSEEQARQLFGLGFMLGIGGPLTYERAKRMHRLVSSMPLEFLLLETDSPDQPGATHRGQRNEPAYLQDVLETVARLRGADPGAIAEATQANARRLLGL